MLERMTTTPRLIGLIGFAGAGKDSVADLLVSEHGFAKVALGDPLRTMLRILDPIVCVTFEHDDQDGAVRYADVLADLGYDATKRHPILGDEVRALLQRMGDALRDDDVLGSAALADIAAQRVARHRTAGTPVVISDVRTPDDLALVLRLGGQVWRIDRPGVGPANSHHTEQLPTEHPAIVVPNSGNLADLQHLVSVLVEVPAVSTAPAAPRVTRPRKGALTKAGGKRHLRTV